MPEPDPDTTGALLRFAIGLPFLIDIIFEPGIDIVPDIIGYLLLWTGADRLRSRFPSARRLWWTCLALIPLGILDFLQGRLRIPDVGRFALAATTGVVEGLAVAALAALVVAATRGTTRRGLGRHARVWLLSLALWLGLRPFVATFLLPTAVGQVVLLIIDVALAAFATSRVAYAAREKPSTVTVRTTPASAFPEPHPMRLLTAVYLFLLVLIGFSILVYGMLGLSVGNSWYQYPFRILYYGFACGVAVALVGGIRARASPALRATLAIVVLAIVWGVAALADSISDRPIALRNNVGFLFRYLLPVLGAIIIVGTGRHTWNAGQLLGATLMFLAVWTPIYASLPELRAVFTSSGTLEPISLIGMYTMVIHKFVVELLIGLFGLLLFVGRIPWVYPRPAPGMPGPLAYLDAGWKRSPFFDLGLGCTALVGALLGTYILAFILSVTGGSGVGSNDSGVYSKVTPDLVILISLAAGLGEELLYRAFLMTYLQRAFSTFMRPTNAFAAALVLQGIAFGVVHSGYANLSHVLNPMAFGLFMGFVFRYWGFAACVYAHVAIDIVAFGLSAVTQFPWMLWAVLLFIVANIIAGVAAAVALIIQWTRHHHDGPTNGVPAPAKP